jgi:5-methylthioribose kinase
VNSESAQQAARSLLPEFEPTTVERLAGGHLNQVFRVRNQERSVVVKHAPPFAAQYPEMPLSPRRSDFEARALLAFGPSGALNHLVGGRRWTPELLAWDRQGHTLIMTDFEGGNPLGKSGQPHLFSEMKALGAFMARLHAGTRGDPLLAMIFNNRTIQEERHRLQYQGIRGICEGLGASDAEKLGAKVEAMGQRFLSPGRCLIMGDLWPASILVHDNTLVLIDWEFAHYGQPAQDLAHLGAHLWMRLCCAQDDDEATCAKTCWESFMEGYRQAWFTSGGDLAFRHTAENTRLHWAAEVLIRSHGPFSDASAFAGKDDEVEWRNDAAERALEVLRGATLQEAFGTEVDLEPV